MTNKQEKAILSDKDFNAILPQRTLLPEWAEQEAVVLAWPHDESDWQPWINEARTTYVKLIKAIADAGAGVILLCHQKDIGLAKSMIDLHLPVLIFQAEFNDTWTRDYVFLSCETARGNQPVEFVFNGWGQKFDARKDNLVNQQLSQLCQLSLVSCDTVLEGGAIEIDQNQILMSTASCLFNPKRNSEHTMQDYESVFTDLLGARQCHVFQNGHLTGDDTDGHIDTLARFTPLRGLVMQSAYNRPDDEHFTGLTALKFELEQAFSDYEIFELPLPDMRNSDGERLPASYANFLICNDCVLAPVYLQNEDEQALNTLQKAFPNHRIVAVDCSAIVQQFGSLHCITMQIPVNTLQPEVLNQMKKGVSVYDA
uniref:agmatine deiminase family protein n=1 Tax=Ningiella ruwaisensis TaxID=2364274 RepID=UPI00109F37A1|nr:agmatine deiminase family protein [Ningiella ruwaisensis]